MKDLDINRLTDCVLGAAIEVHRALGPGLLESAYEKCLCREFDLRNLHYQRQLFMPSRYKEIVLENAYRLDLLVEDQLVLDIKAVEKLLPVHEAQIMTYLRLGNWPVGLLLNFNAVLLKDGIRRIVNNLQE
ncbi:MAG: GxxExxY protein [Anaerolineales bacterium]|nr:GxxExxY protein [Anaerolineales bacterium]